MLMETFCAKQLFKNQLYNLNMQDGIQDGSQNIKNVYVYFYACIPRVIPHFFGDLHNDILGIHLICILSVQSNFGHNPFSAKSLDLFVKFAK